MEPGEEYRCTFCGTTSAVATTCPTCQVAMPPTREQPTWLATRGLLDRPGPNPAQLGLAILTVLVLVAVGLGVRALIGGQLGKHAVEVGLYAGVIAMCAALLYFKGGVRRQARRLLDRAPLIALDAAAEGRVKVRGRARLVRPAWLDGEAPCVAFQHEYTDLTVRPQERRPSLRRGGALFEVVDDHGRCARVLAEDVVLTRDDAILEGALVEVSGLARYVQSAAPRPGDGPRSKGGVLELYSSAGEPIAIHQVSPPAEPGTRVELAVRDEAVARDGSAHAPRDEDSPVARGARR